MLKLRCGRVASAAIATGLGLTLALGVAPVVTLADEVPSAGQSVDIQVEATTVAMVGGDEFSSLSEAVAKAKESGAAVELTANVVLTESIQLASGDKVVIEGNDHTISYDTSSIEAAFTGKAEGSLVESDVEGGDYLVYDFLTLTINNTIFQSSSEVEGPSGCVVLLEENSYNVEVNLAGCSFESLHTAVYVNLITKAPYAAWAPPVLSITGCTYTGTPYAYSVDTLNEDGGAYYEGARVTFSGNAGYQTVAENMGDPEVMVGDDKGPRWNFPSIEAALDAIGENQLFGDAITLQRDINHGIVVDVDDVTINGNGHSIIAEDGDAITVTGDSVKLHSVSAVAKGTNGLGHALVAGSEGSPVGRISVNNGTYRNENVAMQGEGAVRIWSEGMASVDYARFLGGVHVFSDTAPSVTSNVIEFSDTQTSVVGVLYFGGSEYSSAESYVSNNVIYLPNEQSMFAQSIDHWPSDGEDDGAILASEGAAKVGDRYFASLQDAVGVVSDGGTIAIINDCDEDVTVYMPKTFTIEVAAGKTFTGSVGASSGYRVIEKDGTYTIEKYVPPVPSNPGTSTPAGDAVNVEESEGGSVEVTTDRAEAGDEVTITPSPELGQEVRSVKVTDEDGNEVEVSVGEDGTWSFEMPEGEVSIEVVFGCDGGDLCLTHSFADVDQNAWYHDAVDWAVEAHVFNGYGENSRDFGPVNAITRAEMAQVLWNQAGRPESEGDLSGFADVDSNGWYADAAAWCVDQGIFNGYGDAFGTGDVITREDVATVLWRLAGSPEVDADLSGFKDSEMISGYASDAMRWAVSTGVLTGKGGVALDPQGECTRGEVAAMMMRMSK